MRPRRVRLGWDMMAPLDEATLRASMRPRRVRLGWPVERGLFARRHPGFNEAEARAPRMEPCGPTSRPPTWSFNEAEARAPRMARAYVKLCARPAVLQ